MRTEARIEVPRSTVEAPERPRRRRDRVVCVTADLLADASPPIALEDAVRASAPTPLLLIARAPAKELEANGAYAAAAGDRAELWHLAGSPHVGGLSTAPAEYEARVIAFLDAALLAS